MSADARLDQFDRNEWREVREVAPKVTDAEFDLAWAEFVEMKRRKAQH